MKYTSFYIKNFKGIKELLLDFDKTPHSNIFTLIGLNESGKTTILEAINFFQQKSENVDDLVPKSLRANFNDVIQIKATIELSKEDEKKISDHANSLGFILTNEIKKLTISHEYRFQNTVYDRNKEVFWTISLKGYATNSRKKIPDELKSSDQKWHSIVDFISDELIPEIIYYPNFLFNFPPKIYLEQSENEGEEQEFYRAVLQDVLNSLNQNLLLDIHLLDRKKSGKKNELESVESVLNQMSSVITQRVFEAWSKISKVQVNNILVTLGNDVKAEENESGVKKFFLEIKIKEGVDSFSVSERSLGFRWFFAFLLFTQFRRFRSNTNRKYLFLLDEPASNLHETGQQELLSSLEELTDNSTVVFSTHSHHLVNPKWLSGAFVVINRGINYKDKLISAGYTTSQTDIYAERYYSFVANNKDSETYYKPILNVLDYRPSKLEQVPNIVILEGKFDYYFFNYFKEIYFTDRKLHFYPGGGAEHHTGVFSNYLAWGAIFISLFDGDKAGKKAKENYQKEFGLILKDRLFALSEIQTDFDGFTTEDLITEDDRIKIIKQVFAEVDIYEKSKFNSALQELYINNKKVEISQTSADNVVKVFDFLSQKLKQLSK